MKRINTAIAFLLLSMSVTTIPLRAQQTGTPVIGSWDTIKALASREDLTVTLKDGSSKKGKLTDVTDTALILSQGKKLTETDRDGIFRIYRSIPKSRSRATGLGAAVGAGFGAITALVGDGSSGHGVGPGIAIAGVFIMAGVGALIGRGFSDSRERALIYEAKR
jgi:hypothetical protein